jgi:hypothetical protein
LGKAEAGAGSVNEKPAGSPPAGQVGYLPKRFYNFGRVHWRHVLFSALTGAAGGSSLHILLKFQCMNRLNSSGDMAFNFSP